MMIGKLGAATALLLALGACASEAKDKIELGVAHAPSQAEATRILAFARTIRQAKGCEPALPAYRVIAAMGEGFEAAQDELGECLLEAPGAGATEMALRRDEALLWLKRAAYAGNARAQRALAILYAEPTNAEHSDESALKWALLYKANSDAQLYGYGDFPPTFLPGLEQSLGADKVAAAKAFAQSFAPLHMAIYQGPARPQSSDRGFRRAGRGEGPYGGRRRPGGDGPGDDGPGDGDEGGQP